MTSAATIADLFPDAWTHDVRGEPQVFLCTVQIAKAAPPEAVEQERAHAVADLYRDVTRRTGLTREELAARTALRWQDYSSNLVNSRLEIAALVPLEAA